jgi:hypothetical protein
MADTREMADTEAAAKPSPIAAGIVPAAQTTREENSSAQSASMAAAAISPAASPALSEPENSSVEGSQTGGTVVLDVEEGGIEVPSFLGKNLRMAIEAAQDLGLDLDAIGSGTAREQSPPPGSHVAAGARITVRFGR